MLVLILILVGGVAFVGIRMRHNARIEDAYKEFRVDQSIPGAAPEHTAYELPAAPDLSALIAAEGEPPMLASKPVTYTPVYDEEGLPKAPKLED